MLKEECVFWLLIFCNFPIEFLCIAQIDLERRYERFRQSDVSLYTPPSKNQL